ncbi:hypothetical protein NDU88_002183 [Pleurodeles waltl]|uniref:Uncharacterized protein n=1 Tax=Pleurodeles waltl TaxID=8319 RepID=A0AAV7WKP0_PLEWA|nr:hypothetical protein NDU88_002183 [Pleurodeles waltl]
MADCYVWPTVLGAEAAPLKRTHKARSGPFEAGVCAILCEHTYEHYNTAPPSLGRVIEVQQDYGKCGDAALHRATWGTRNLAPGFGLVDLGVRKTTRERPDRWHASGRGGSAAPSTSDCTILNPIRSRIMRRPGAMIVLCGGSMCAPRGAGAQ